MVLYTSLKWNLMEAKASTLETKLAPNMVQDIVTPNALMTLNGYMEKLTARIGVTMVSVVLKLIFGKLINTQQHTQCILALTLAFKDAKVLNVGTIHRDTKDFAIKMDLISTHTETDKRTSSDQDLNIPLTQPKLSKL